MSGASGGSRRYSFIRDETPLSRPHQLQHARACQREWEGQWKARTSEEVVREQAPQAKGASSGGRPGCQCVSESDGARRRAGVSTHLDSIVRSGRKQPEPRVDGCALADSAEVVDEVVCAAGGQRRRCAHAAVLQS